MAMGSPMYMSPEQIRAASNIDGRADIWALGCVLYELLTGNPAFSAPSLTELCAQILESKPPAPGSLGLPVPPELEAVIGRCLEKDPRRRFRNVGELAMALSPFAPSRSLISVERCCNAQAVEVVVPEQLADAATLPSFVPRRPQVKWKRIAVAGLGASLAYTCGALLFAPHAELPGAVATLQSEAQLGTATSPALHTAPSSTASPSSTREGESSAAPSGRTPTAQSQRVPQAPTKPAVIKSKPRPAPPSSKEEIDVGF